MFLVGYTNVANVARAEPPGEDEPGTIDPGALGGAYGPVVTVEKNDTCADAEEIAPLMMLQPPGGLLEHKGGQSSYTARAHDRKFHNGSSVDDWYMYVTHDMQCPMYHYLVIEVVCDKPQVEVELYEECYMWPIASSMYQEVITAFDPEHEIMETEIQPLSGLEKEVTIIEAEDNADYYIHVNCLAAPEGEISYDLTVREYCVEIT
jgi:hypothetical protein